MTLEPGAIEYVIEWPFSGPGEAVAKWYSELPDRYRPVTQVKVTDKGEVPWTDQLHQYRVSGYYVVDPGWKQTDGSYQLEAHPDVE